MSRTGRYISQNDRPAGIPLPLEHVFTRYGSSQVCVRCGQDWPCTFVDGREPEPECSVDAYLQRIEGR